MAVIVFMNSLLFVLALELAGSGPTLDLLDLHAAFERVAEVAAARGTVMTLSYESGPNGAPLSSALDRDGKCRVTFSPNADGFKVVGALGSGVPAARRGAFLEAVFAHELGHCEQFALARRDFTRSEIVDPERASRIHSFADLKSAWGATDLTLWTELLADVAAGLYLQQVHPEECEFIMRALLENRRRYSIRDAGHATARYFRGADACVAPGSGERPIDAAIRVRTELVRSERERAVTTP